MNGNVQQKSLSSASLTDQSLAKVLEVVLLMLAGVLAIVLHTRFRSPINVPGHHGIEFMAIILAARLSSKIKWASSISALGIGIFILFPVLGFKDPMMGFNYMLPCFFIDFAYNFLQDKKYNKILIAVAAGYAYMLVPFSRLITTSVTGYPYSSFLKHGFVLPIFTFLFFGLAGGILGIGINSLGKKLFNKI